MALRPLPREAFRLPMIPEFQMARPQWMAFAYQAVFGCSRAQAVRRRGIRRSLEVRPLVTDHLAPLW